MKFLYKSKTGMTLVEILITVSLFAAVSLAIYRSLDGGIRVWKKSQQLVIEENIAIFFDKFTSDLRNAFEYSLIEAKGTENSLLFPALVYTPQDQALGKDAYVRQIGSIEYYFDAGERAVYRRQFNYSQAVKNKMVDAKKVLSGIDEMNLKYFFMSEKKGIDSRNFSAVLPYGLEVEIKFTDMYGARSLNKIIFIPKKI
ncbi:MAG: prepilin-type N-terminal cleavage/methylation domain-containing protein [Candidatus Omnitrophica bacterium]|nr:prepilin-type N-terminal cleavage/methylation domain-containing protein [Candidatus Omnitrophota bacterium]